MTDDTEYKCIGCSRYKFRSDFYDSSAANAKDGRNPYCTHCCKVNRSLEGVRKRDKRSKMSVRQQQRAKNLGIARDHSLTLAKVFKRYHGWCGICNEWVQPKHASMDHIKPLSKGGTHTFCNVQLSHLKCNLRKGAMYES